MDNEAKRILIIDDDEHICKLWGKHFRDARFRVETGNGLVDLKDILKRYSIDAVLLDLELDGENGVDGLHHIVSESPATKVFIFTGNAAVDSAVETLKEGATDYITKDSPAADVLQKVKDAVSNSEFLEGEGDAFASVGFIGQGKAFQKVCETVEQVKDVDSTILLQGESGTGKEVVAKAIHSLSQRSKERFEAINCAAVPENLLESELFGHKKGSFTDAKSDRKGIFEICSEGTLLLDEIGDMPAALQSKLLRVLQEREVLPVGASNPVKINTRVLAATHRDLQEEIQTGRFREDLYFRLSVVPLNIPPLRHRKDDIPLLVEHFVGEFNSRFKKNIAPPRPEVFQRLKAYDWPGNIRELRNAIERAVVLAKNDELNVEDLFFHIKTSSSDAEVGVSTADFSAGLFELPLTDAKQAFEKLYVEKLLEETEGNIAEIGRRAGRYRADIYRMFEKYGIDHTTYRK